MSKFNKFLRNLPIINDYMRLSNIGEMLAWLDENVHPAFYDDGKKYNSSTTGMFIEWVSKDKESWQLRISGIPPKISVNISDPKVETLFWLRFK